MWAAFELPPHVPSSPGPVPNDNTGGNDGVRKDRELWVPFPELNILMFIVKFDETLDVNHVNRNLSQHGCLFGLGFSRLQQAHTFIIYAGSHCQAYIIIPSIHHPSHKITRDPKECAENMRHICRFKLGAERYKKSKSWNLIFQWRYNSTN